MKQYTPEPVSMADLISELMQCQTELEEASSLLLGVGLKGCASLYLDAARRVAATIASAAQEGDQ